jgi:hypothetical protein
MARTGTDNRVLWVWGVVVVLVMRAVASGGDVQRIVPPADLVATRQALALQESRDGRDRRCFAARADGSLGIYQIRPVMVQDVNRILGRPEFIWPVDALDRARSEQIFVIYSLHYYPAGTPEQWARAWNGGPRGPRKASTLQYWRGVRAFMDGSRSRRADLMTDQQAATSPSTAGTIHAARLSSSHRLRSVLAVLQDHQWHSTRDLIRRTGACAINSVMTELRANSVDYECRQRGRIHEYRLTPKPVGQGLLF